MKKIIIRILLIFTLFSTVYFFVVHSAWYFEEFVKVKDKTGDQLFLEFRSFQTNEKVKEILKSKGIGWIDYKTTTKQRTFMRAKFSAGSLEAPGFEYMGASGDLIFNFNNDRLYQVIFKPKDMKNFLQIMSIEYKNNFSVKKKIMIGKDTELLFQDISTEHPVFIWTSKILIEEIISWYSIFD